MATEGSPTTTSRAAAKHGRRGDGLRGDSVIKLSRDAGEPRRDSADELFRRAVELNRRGDELCEGSAVELYWDDTGLLSGRGWRWPQCGATTGPLSVH